MLDMNYCDLNDLMRKISGDNYQEVNKFVEPEKNQQFPTIV